MMKRGRVMVRDDKMRIEDALTQLVDELERLFRYSPDAAAAGMKFMDGVRREMATGMGRSPDTIVAAIEKVLAFAIEHRKDTQCWNEKYGAIWPKISPEAKTDWEIKQFRADRRYDEPGGNE